MPRTWARGDHLIPAEEVEERAERERQERIRRFSQGAVAIDRANGPAPGTGYVGRDEPVTGGQLIQDDSLEARFAALNARYAE